MFNKTNNPKRFLLLILTLFIINSSLLIATIRYVSHTGSNTPPYTSWETAADSIMFAINISQFGDTIYVANGIYKEQVVMIPGLSLIGAGMDSCIVDTRDFSAPWPFISIAVTDSCFLKGFKIIVANNPVEEWGIGDMGSSGSTATFNRVTSSGLGIVVNNLDTSKISNIFIYKNVADNIKIGVNIFNSNSVVRGNAIYPIFHGIDYGAYFSNYSPLIDSNYIVTSDDGIRNTFGTKATIKNNTIFLDDDFAQGFLGGGDTLWFSNNLIVAKNARIGIQNTLTPTFNYSNFLIGNFRYRGISTGDNNIITNNTIINSPKGISNDQGNPIIQYNNSWNNAVNYGGFTPDSTNLSVDPMVVNEDSTQGELDFHLQMFSPLIDAGDPNILDKDSTRSDIGLYGGPFGERYIYLDLAPKPPRNLSAIVDTEYIKLSWNRNTASDFKNYSLFRDTTADFTADSTTFIADLTDTFYVQVVPPGIDAFYYKLTATDKQGNVSVLSEELAVLITSVNEYPAIVSNYQLYQNYPNPFNPSTKIGYKLKERGYVKLYVYDIKGELVEVLVNQIQEAGYYEVEFHSVGAGLRPDLASGVYIYQIHIMSENNIPVFSDIKKMLMIK